MNIRNETDRATIEAKGFKFVTVQPRGESKGTVISKHKTYDAAERRANGLDLQILAVAEAHTY